MASRALWLLAVNGKLQGRFPRAQPTQLRALPAGPSHAQSPCPCPCQGQFVLPVPPCSYPEPLEQSLGSLCLLALGPGPRCPFRQCHLLLLPLLPAEMPSVSLGWWNRQRAGGTDWPFPLTSHSQSPSEQPRALGKVGMELWGDLCPLPVPHCPPTLRDGPGAAQAEELRWGWLEPSVEQDPGGIQPVRTFLELLETSAGASGSCWVSLEQPGLAKALLGWVLGELWGELGWGSCVPCRINPFVTHSRSCRQGLEPLTVQRHWEARGERGKGESMGRGGQGWAGCRAPGAAPAQGRTQTFLASQKAEMAGASLLPGLCSQ